MEADLGAIKDTLLELSGEEGLALKITGNVRDCLTLDLVQSIHDAVTETIVLQQMQQNPNDARVALQGILTLERFLSLVEGRFSAEFPTSREFVQQARGLDTVISCMANNPGSAMIQKNGCAILRKILNYSEFHSITDFLKMPQEGTMALVNAMDRHFDNVEVLEVCVSTLSVMEKTQTKYNPHLHEDSDPHTYPFQMSVAAVPRGISLLFAALERYPTNYGIGACALNVLQSLRLDDLSFESLVQHAREHPEWRTIVARCNATGGLESYLLRIALARI